MSEWLGARGITAQVTREPGGTPLAERVRKIVLERGTESVPPVAETLLMFAARSIHSSRTSFGRALERGEWVICDRFTDATRAYQGYGRGTDMAWIEQLAVRRFTAICSQDCTLLLDLAGRGWIESCLQGVQAWRPTDSRRR